MSLKNKILAYCISHLGVKVDRGECWDLAENALKSANAKTSNDLGKVGADTDYIWGSEISLSAASPGCIIQFRNYKYVKETSNERYLRSENQTRPHHTAIIEKVNGKGEIVVLEQNVGNNKKVHRNTLYFETTTYKDGRNTIAISVTGKFKIYEPLPKNETAANVNRNLRLALNSSLGEFKRRKNNPLFG